MKLTTLFGAALMLGAGLITLLSSTGCGSVYSEYVSERLWSEPRSFQFQGNDRRDR